MCIEANAEATERICRRKDGGSQVVDIVGRGRTSITWLEVAGQDIIAICLMARRPTGTGLIVKKILPLESKCRLLQT